MRSIYEWRVIKELASPAESGEAVTPEEAEIDRTFHASLQSTIAKYMGWLTELTQGKPLSFKQKAFIAQEVLRALNFRSPSELQRAISVIKNDMNKTQAAPTAQPPGPPADASAQGI